MKFSSGLLWIACSARGFSLSVLEFSWFDFRTLALTPPLLLASFGGRLSRCKVFGALVFFSLFFQFWFDLCGSSSVSVLPRCGVSGRSRSAPKDGVKDFV